MNSKNYQIFYIFLIVIGIGLTIFGGVFYQQILYNNTNSRIALSKENKEYWGKSPYGVNSVNHYNISFFNWLNPEELLSDDKIVSVKEINFKPFIDESSELIELNREAYSERSTEIVKLKTKYTRKYESKSAKNFFLSGLNDYSKNSNNRTEIIRAENDFLPQLTKENNFSYEINSIKRNLEDKDVTFDLLNIGAIKYWSQIKNTPNASIAIKLLYKQLKEIEQYYYSYILKISNEKITDYASFSTSNLFKDLTFEEKVKEKMYDLNKLSFKNNPSFFFLLKECNKNVEVILSTASECTLFTEIFGITSKDFATLSSNFRTMLTDKLKIDFDKTTFARNQWAKGSYISESIYNNNSTYFNKEFFSYVKDQKKEISIDWSFEIITKLIDYSFVLKNDNDDSYIAKDDEKSLLFDKELVDGIFEGSVTSLGLKEVSKEQEDLLFSYLKQLLNIDLTNVKAANNDLNTNTDYTSDQRKRVLLEISEFNVYTIYTFANTLGYKLFLNLVSSEAFKNYFNLKTCEETIKFITDAEKIKSICNQYNQLLDVENVLILLEGVMYDKDPASSFLKNLLTSSELAEFNSNFNSQMKEYISTVNTKYIKDDKFSSYLDLDFSVFGAEMLFTSNYRTITSYTKLSEISDDFKNIFEFEDYCKSKSVKNPFTSVIIREAASFDKLFSVNFLIKSFVDNLKNIKTEFSSDVFLSYLRGLYISLKLNNLKITKTISNNTKNDVNNINNWIFSYTDDLLQKYQQTSILYGGNKAIKKDVNIIFERDNVLDSEIYLYTGYNNTILTRRYFSITGDKEDKNKATIFKNYYPGNNGALIKKKQILKDSGIIRNCLNTTDGFILPGKINHKRVLDEDEKTDTNLHNFYYDDIIGKIILNKTNTTTAFSKAFKLDRYTMNSTVQFASNSDGFIEMEEAYDYPIVAGLKYLSNSKLAGNVDFNSKKEDMKKENFDSYLEIEPISGLTVNSNISFMYSIIIKPDDLFSISKKKVIPIYYKSKQLSLNKEVVNDYLDQLLLDSLIASLLMYFGVGFITFGILMNFYAYFKPDVPKDLIKMSSNVSTYGAFAEAEDGNSDNLLKESNNDYQINKIKSNESRSDKEVIDTYI